MLIADLQNFGGMQPKKDPHELDGGDAEYAEGIVLKSGSLEPEVIPLQVDTVTKAGTIKSIYFYVDVWLHWTTDVDVVRSPTAGDTDNRIIFTGDGVPKITDYTLATTGVGTDYPLDSYTLGLPAPTINTSLTISGGTTPTEARSYVYTFVTGWGEEGPPSDPKSATGNVNGTWNFDGMVTSLAGDYNVTHKNIYRTVTNSQGEAEYHYVTQVTLATANYADTNSNATVAANDILPSDDWIAPPTTLAGIQAVPGSFLVGFVPDTNKVCFSEPGQPHAWPLAYQYETEHIVIGVKVSGFNIVVATTGNPVLFSGSHPASMGMAKADTSEPCVSKRAMVDVGKGVQYPSPNGLIEVNVGGARNVTKDILSRDQWQKSIGYSSYAAAVSGDLIAARYQGKYLYFNASGGRPLNFIAVDDTKGKPYYYVGTFCTGDSDVAKGLFVNQEYEEQLYFVDSSKKVWIYGLQIGDINSATLQADVFSGVTSFHRAVWWSRRIRTAKPCAARFIRVQADMTQAPDWLTGQDEMAVVNIGITPGLDDGAIGAHAIGEAEIGGGLAIAPLFISGLESSVEPGTLNWLQGFVQVDIYAGNSQGAHDGNMDALSFIDSVVINGGHPVAIPMEGDFDVWQMRVTATCRVRRIQLCESMRDLRGS